MNEMKYEHKKIGLGFEVTTEHLREAAARYGLTPEAYLAKLALAVPGIEIESIPK